jgi:hypothetical protein
VITPGYVESLSMDMTEGRAFTGSDREGAPRVVIVNAALASRHFPSGAIGRRLTLGDTVRYEIVGVVGNVRHDGPAADARPELYLPFDQNPRSELTFAVRTASGDAASLLPSMRKTVNELDPELPVYDERTMARVVALAIGPVRLSVSLLTVLASLALVLAMIGIYGVASQLVAERTREIGIRTALGSTGSGVVRFIVARGLKAVSIGAGVGLVAAGVLSRTIASQMAGVPTLDVVTYLSVAVLLFTAAMFAIYIPARRVSRIDPMVVLRTEGA